jgi:tRNA splicing ligase
MPSKLNANKRGDSSLFRDELQKRTFFNKTGVHMNITLLRQARQLFTTYDASPDVIRTYQRKWARSVHQLGPNWLLAQKITKVQ